MPVRRSPVPAPCRRPRPRRAACVPPERVTLVAEELEDRFQPSAAALEPLPTPAALAPAAIVRVGTDPAVAVGAGAGAYLLTSVTFEQGTNGYTGIADTYVDVDNPTATHGGDDDLFAEGGAEDLQGLLRFDDVFGSGPGQIPFGSTIDSASLVFFVTNNAVATQIDFHRMLTPWSESATWNALGGGIQRNDVEAASAADVTFGNAGASDSQTVAGFASAVQSWSDGAANHGWAFFSNNAKWGFNSSEKNASKSPKLVVQYTATNRPPVAGANAYTTTAGTTLAVPASGTLVDDTDADGDVLSAALVSGPSNGTLQLNPDGSFVYAPAPGFVGTDAFTYRATDPTGAASGSATVAIRVLARNGAPTAADDEYTARRRVVWVGRHAGALANDADPDGDRLTARLVARPAHGAVYLARSGGFFYVARPGFAGTDSFTYRVVDASGAGSAPATVTVHVPGRGDRADEDTETYRVVQGQVLAVPGPQRDTDDDHGFTASLLAPAAHGEVAVRADGSFTYTPRAGFTGTDTFTYRVSDGDAETVVTVRVAVVPAARPGSPAPAPSARAAELPAPGLVGDVISLATGLTPATPVGAPGEDAPADGVPRADARLVAFAVANDDGNRGDGFLPPDAGPPPASEVPVAPAKPGPAEVPAAPPAQPPAPAAAPAPPDPQEIAPLSALMVPDSIAAADAVGGALDQVARDLGADTDERATTDAVIATGVVATAGFVLLNTRAVYWFLSALLARPAVWRRFDPLDVIYTWEKEQELGTRPEEPARECESLQSMVG